VLCFVSTCALSFLTAVVMHHHMHQGIFRARWLNLAFRCVLSFGLLFPASSLIPVHNLVHHHFDDDGQPDWAASEHVAFRWNLLNLLHFPNVAGTYSFTGMQRWARLAGRREFRRQLAVEQAVAFGGTAVLLALDFWTALFFVVLPQLWGARSFLRINILQHDGCDVRSEWNHSRNFTGRVFNWLLCNDGFHTIHHNRAGLHWVELQEAHAREVAPRIDPTLEEPSMLRYLLRTYLWNLRRPAPRAVAGAEAAAPAVAGLASRAARRAEAEAAASA
jgi:fatty acid desaturase